MDKGKRAVSVEEIAEEGVGEHRIGPRLRKDTALTRFLSDIGPTGANDRRDAPLKETPVKGERDKFIHRWIVALMSGIPQSTTQNSAPATVPCTHRPSAGR
jgi:hypothetical protein